MSERLSNCRSALGRINALERRLDAAEAGAAERPSADGAGPSAAKRRRADPNERPEGQINALERRLAAPEPGLAAGG
jgi:hypothetical protein